jgi:hypothetical protein
LNRSAMKVASRWMIANIALDDALILPHRANPRRIEFSRTTGGIERGFVPIGAGNLAVNQEGPELAVSCANSFNG